MYTATSRTSSTSSSTYSALTWEDFVHDREMEGFYPGSYAGVTGSGAPPEVQQALRKAAIDLWIRGWTLRAGDEDNDSAINQGVAKASEIFLPWAKLHARKELATEPPPEAFDVAERFHPMWDNLNQPSRRLMARIVQQVLGPDLKSPISFALCWTEDGANGATIPTRIATGAAGQAIRVAAAYGIPVFNLGGRQTS